MLNYLLPRLENIINVLIKDFKLIAGKNKDDEWKREHYIYTFTVIAQRMYEMLNSQISEKKITPPRPSTKKEMLSLMEKLDKIINS